MKVFVYKYVSGLLEIGFKYKKGTGISHFTIVQFMNNCKRRLKGTGRGDWESLLSYKIPQRQHERRGVAGRLTSPQTLVVGCLNVRGCSTIESKRCEIGCMFGRRGMDVLALCETKMKGKGEVAFGEVTGSVWG